MELVWRKPRAGASKRSSPPTSATKEKPGTPRSLHSLSKSLDALFKPSPCPEDEDCSYVLVQGSLWGIASKPSSTDVSQGDLNNCYLVAALALVADNFPGAIRAAVKPVQGHTSNPSSSFSLFEVTFQLPARARRNRTVATEGTQTVLVDNRFWVRKRRRRKKVDGNKGKKGGGEKTATRSLRSSHAKQEQPPVGRRKRKSAEVAAREEDAGGVEGEGNEQEGEASDEDFSTCDTLYMRSATSALWPLLMEKAWVQMLCGASYSDICAEGSSDFSSARVASHSAISPHAGSVVQALTGIMFDMYQIALRSDEQLWQDFQSANNDDEASGGGGGGGGGDGGGGGGTQAAGMGKPCFVGTLRGGEQARQLYADAQRKYGIRLFANHCYSVTGAHEGDDGERYFAIRNPHNRSSVEATEVREAQAERDRRKKKKKGEVTLDGTTTVGAGAGAGAGSGGDRRGDRRGGEGDRDPSEGEGASTSASGGASAGETLQLKRACTLKSPARIRRINTVNTAVLPDSTRSGGKGHKKRQKQKQKEAVQQASALRRGEHFLCTVEELRRYFVSYEVSRRGNPATSAAAAAAAASSTAGGSTGSAGSGGSSSGTADGGGGRLTRADREMNMSIVTYAGRAWSEEADAHAWESQSQVG